MRKNESIDNFKNWLAGFRSVFSAEYAVKAIDSFWLETLRTYAAKGLPVIDLRSAQEASGTEQIQRRALLALLGSLQRLCLLVTQLAMVKLRRPGAQEPP